MANRALAAKAERAARQKREAARIEFSKPAYLATPKSELRAMRATAVVNGDTKVTICATERPRVTHRMGGNPARRGALIADCYVFESRLIRG